jgi:hypothetical protein
MSPERERLLAALWERDTCEPGQRPRWNATVERPISDALARQPRLSREMFMGAVAVRYGAYRRARRKFPTLPPTA